MFDNIKKVLGKMLKKEKTHESNSKEAAKERLHLVLMQDRANVSADFLELMKQEIIDVIKKYIEVDENAIDVRLTNKDNGDGTKGAPALYANIPIKNIKDETRKKSQTNVTSEKEMINEVAESEKQEASTKDAVENNVSAENVANQNTAEEAEILNEAEQYIKAENDEQKA